MPLRKEPLSPQRHILWLRLSMVGVAVFAFLFGIFFRQTEYIFLWWTVTMAIYIGGAGAVIIGGCIGKKARPPGVGGASHRVVALRRRHPGEADLGRCLPDQCSAGFVLRHSACAGSYVVVSLLTCREDFNMDRLLHRGAYAVNDPALKPIAPMPRSGAAWSA